jgi:hypothetical protein
MADRDFAHTQIFLLQSAQAAGRSPLYEHLCRHLAHEEVVADILESPPRWDSALRLLSGLHYLVLSGRADWGSVDRTLRDHRAFLRRFVAEQAVQTNEVQRCWMLLPCFLELAERFEATTLDVIELGSSAGLNLAWDSYRYTYDAGAWGPPDAPLAFSGEERRPVPPQLLRRTPAVRSRIGVDLAPLDVTTADGARLLKSFIWADQTDRLARLDRAIDIARAHPPQLIGGDIADVLPDLLRSRAPDVVTVVWQTAVLGYLPDDRRRMVHDALSRAGRDGHLAYVGTTTANDGSDLHYGLTIQTWPGGEREQLAHADFHGAWIDWLDDGERHQRRQHVVAV